MSTNLLLCAYPRIFEYLTFKKGYNQKSKEKKNLIRKNKQLNTKGDSAQRDSKIILPQLAQPNSK